MISWLEIRKQQTTFFILVLTLWKILQNLEICFLTIEQTGAVVSQIRVMYFRGCFRWTLGVEGLSTHIRMSIYFNKKNLYIIAIYN